MSQIDPRYLGIAEMLYYSGIDADDLQIHNCRFREGKGDSDLRTVSRVGERIRGSERAISRMAERLVDILEFQ